MVRWRCAAAAGRRGEHAGFSFSGGPGPQQAATASRPRFRRAAAVSRGVWSETDRDRNSLASRRAPPTDDPLVPCVCLVKIKYILLQMTILFARNACKLMQASTGSHLVLLEGMHAWGRGRENAWTKTIRPYACMHVDRLTSSRQRHIYYHISCCLSSYIPASVYRLYTHLIVTSAFLLHIFFVWFTRNTVFYSSSIRS